MLDFSKLSVQILLFDGPATVKYQFC